MRAAGIQNSHERFDLIVFSLLDSHTTSSNFSKVQVRTDYVIAHSGKLLLPDFGLFVVKFQVDPPVDWRGRLQGLLTTVFDQKPLQMQSASQYGTPGRFFLVRDQQRNFPGAA